MSDHRRFQMLAAKAIDFGSSTAEARELAVHLASCLDCRRFDSGLRADAAVAGGLRRTHAPARVRTAIVAAASVQREPLIGFGVVLRAVGAVATGVVLLAALTALNRTSLPSSGHPAPRTWARLADTAPFAGGQVSAVEIGGPGLIAVGNATSGAGDGAVWTSIDGSAWSREPANPSLAGAPLTSIARNGSTIVAGGLGGFLVSTDGRSWQATPAPPSYAGCVGSVAITPGGPGFVAVARNGCSPSTLSNPIVTSPDGRTWSEAPGTTFRGATVTGIASDSSELVAVGSVSGAPAIWTSSDGRIWTLVPADRTPPHGRLLDVAAAGSEFVVVGSVGGRAATWTSPDGRSWQEQPASASPDGASMSRVIAIGGTLVALGESSAGDGLAWVSSDGSSWSRLATGNIFAGARILAFGRLNTRWMLFGEDDSGRVVVAVSNG